MLEIIQRAVAGTMESSDAYVEVAPASHGVTVHLESVVKQQFGQQILQTVQSVLDAYEVQNADISVADRGALDCVIRARLETALLRGGKQ